MHSTQGSSNGRVRVAMLGPSPDHPGGVTKVVSSWRESGLEQALDVRSIHTSRWDDPRLLQALQAARALLSLLLILARRRADVVLLHLSTGGSAWRKLVGTYLCRLFRTPYVVQLHSGEYEEWVGRSRLAAAGSRSLLSHAATAIVVSPRWEALARRLGARDVAVIPNALSAAERRALAPPTDPPPPPAVPTLLFLGRWAPVKGPDRIAAALAAIPSGRFAVHLFGNGDRAFLERAFAGLPMGATTIGGWIDIEAKATELHRATALVVPSRAEGFGQVLIEARAAGVPVLATDVGGVADVVAGYDRALLVPDDDAELAAAIARIVAGDWPPAERTRTADLPERFHAEHAVVALAGVLARAAAPPPAS